MNQVSEGWSVVIGVAITIGLVAVGMLYHWYMEDYRPRRAQLKYIRELTRAINEGKRYDQRD